MTAAAKANVTLSMNDLLARAGFKLRGRNRADCTHCNGSSYGTVAYTNEVAHCHRCHWKANTITLAKELGLFATDPESKHQRREQAREIAEYRRTIERFEVWRDTHIRKFSTELRQLGRAATIATEVLKKYPDCEPAWDALARYCHREGELNQMLDWLTCAKASTWLEEDSTILIVFDAWKREFDAKR